MLQNLRIIIIGSYEIKKSQIINNGRPEGDPQGRGMFFFSGNDHQAEGGAQGAAFIRFGRE